MSLKATRDHNTMDGFFDEYGTRWTIYTDDGNGHWAVESEDEYIAGEATKFADGTIEIVKREDSKTFGVSCQDEFIVEDGRWTENESDDA